MIKIIHWDDGCPVEFTTDGDEPYEVPDSRYEWMEVTSHGESNKRYVRGIRID